MGSEMCIRDRINSLPALTSFDMLTTQDAFTSICGLTTDGSVVCIGDNLPALTVPGDASGGSFDNIPVAENLSFSVYSDSTVELFWDINTPFLSRGANIYRDGELLTFTRNGRSFVDDTLEENQEYVYTVALVGRSGVEGPLSDPILVSTDGRTPDCLLYTSPSPRDATLSRMPSSA